MHLDVKSTAGTLTPDAEQGLEAAATDISIGNHGASL